MLLEAVKAMFIPAGWTAVIFLSLSYLTYFPAFISPQYKNQMADTPKICWLMGMCMAGITILIFLIRKIW